MFFCFSLAENKAASHFEQMSSSFRSKVQHLAESVISDVTSSASASASAPVTVPAPAAEVARDVIEEIMAIDWTTVIMILIYLLDFHL